MTNQEEQKVKRELAHYILTGKLNIVGVSRMKIDMWILKGAKHLNWFCFREI